MRNVTGALAATRLFDVERAEVSVRRRTRRRLSERPCATAATAQTGVTKSRASTGGPTQSVRESGAE